MREVHIDRADEAAFDRIFFPPLDISFRIRPLIARRDRR